VVALQVFVNGAENPAEDRMMNMSEDGKTLAFISSRTQQNELWIKDLETGSERQVTRSGANMARLSRSIRRIVGTSRTS